MTDITKLTLDNETLVEDAEAFIANAEDAAVAVAEVAMLADQMLLKSCELCEVLAPFQTDELTDLGDVFGTLEVHGVWLSLQGLYIKEVVKRLDLKVTSEKD